jgi:ABC-2 type transport system ATP-binding protein
VGDPKSRQRVGYLPEGHRFPGYLSARQTLSIFGRMSGMDRTTLQARIPDLLARVRLSDWADVKVKKFSKGMTQRLGLASALVHDPEVLLLDEPTDGVDPVGRREIRDLLREEAARGRAILLNSHLLSEIELTCDRVAVLRRGKVAAQGRIADLTAQGSRYRMTVSPVDEPLLEAFRASGAGVERVNGHLVLTTRDLAHLNTLVDTARSRGGVLSELSPVRSSLEDVFVDLVRTGEAKEEEEKIQ